MQLSKILKTGAFKGLDGNLHTFTSFDLQSIAANYKYYKKIAPVVVGHPLNDKPSLGLVTALLVHNNELYAELDYLLPSLVDAVKSSRYKYTSPSFYAINHSENPTKGYLYLKHLGFLGAATPAIKEIGSVLFDDIEANTIAPSGFSINESTLKQHHRVLMYKKVLGISYDKAINIILELDR